MRQAKKTLNNDDGDTNEDLFGGALEATSSVKETEGLEEIEGESLNADNALQGAESTSSTYEEQLKRQPQKPVDTASATQSLNNDNINNNINNNIQTPSSLGAMTEEQRTHREVVIRETLYKMGVASTMYQTELSELAVHYRHQMANNQGNVDPHLLEQINRVKHNLHQLSAHYVQFTNLVNSGAPLPHSPMRSPQPTPNPVGIPRPVMSPAPGPMPALSPHIQQQQQ